MSTRQPNPDGPAIIIVPTVVYDPEGDARKAPPIYDNFIIELSNPGLTIAFGDEERLGESHSKCVIIERHHKPSKGTDYYCITIDNASDPVATVEIHKDKTIVMDAAGKVLFEKERS